MIADNPALLPTETPKPFPPPRTLKSRSERYREWRTLVNTITNLRETVNQLKQANGRARQRIVRLEDELVASRGREQHLTRKLREAAATTTNTQETTI